MTYPGGKNASGVVQRIINLMPPHDTYIEPFLGSGAVLRAKKPAYKNIGIDLDQNALDLCRDLSAKQSIHSLQLGCGITYLDNHIFGPDTMVFYDPPYVTETRTHKKIYAHELSDVDHVRLLALMLKSNAMQMITGYRCELYNNALAGWNSVDYQAQTRGGMRTETLWFNFDEPSELHDYRYLGNNFRERDRIKKQQRRWKAKWQRMDRLERLAILAVINDANEELSSNAAISDAGYDTAENDDVISPELAMTDRGIEFPDDGGDEG